MSPQKRSPRKMKRGLIADKTLKDTRKAPSTFEEINANLKKAGWGKDKLTQELEAAFCNIGVSFLNLKPHFELLKKANEIFVDADTLMSRQTLETLDGFVAHSLFVRAYSCFFGAVRLSCSGQLAETWILLRACIENSLYAFYILGHPEHATIWVSRHKNEDDKKKCRDTFKVGNIWAELKMKSKDTATEAKELYDKTIDWGAHPNERSVFPNIAPKQDDSGYALRVVNPDPAFIRSTIIYTMRTSLLTFTIFALVFPEVFSQPNLDMKIKNLNRQLRPLMASLVVRLNQQSTKYKAGEK